MWCDTESKSNCSLANRETYFGQKERGIHHAPQFQPQFLLERLVSVEALLYFYFACTFKSCVTSKP